MEMEDIRSASRDSSEGLKINLEQMQLNELQKISSQLQTQRLTTPMGTTTIAGQVPTQTTFSPVAVNGVPSGGVISTQPLGGLNGRFAYGNQLYGMPSTLAGVATNPLNQAISMGAMALSGGQQIQGGLSSTLKEMKESNQNFFEKMFDKIANFPLVKYHNIDYSRTSDKGIEAIQEQSKFAVQRAGLDVAQGAASIGGGIAGMSVGSTIGTALGTFVGGPPGAVIGNIAGSILGSSVGSSAGSGAVGIIKDQVQDRQDYSTYLQENAYKFINSMETNNTKVNSGFTAEERKDASKWLANLNTDFNMTDDEINTILQNVTESGMLKSTSDLDSFKKKFSSLVKTVKEGAMTLNLSYEEMSQMLADMNKQGIKSDAEQALMIDKLKAVADLTGMDVSDLYNASSTLQSQLYGGTSVNPTQSLANSTELTALGSSFMETVGQGLKGKDAEKVEEAYGFTYNTALNNKWTNEDMAQNIARINGQLIDPNSATGSVAAGMLAYAAEFDGGNVVGFNQERMAQLNQYLSKGDLNGANELAKKWMASDKNSGTILAQMQQMNGTELYGYMINNLGSKDTSKFINSLADAYTYTDDYVSDDLNFTAKGAAQTLTHYGLNANDARVMYEYNKYAASSAGDNVRDNVSTSESKSSIRRNSSKNQSVGFFQGIKNKAESAAQNVTSFITDDFAPSLPFADTLLDFFSGDSAMRAGYGSAGFNIDNYTDVYNEISDNKDLFKKAGIADKAVQIGDYSNEDLTKSLLGKISLVNKHATLFGVDSNSTAKLKKVIKGNDKLSEEEQKQLLNQLSTSEGQTQSAVTGYLELAQDIGGNDYRKKLINSVDVSSYGSFFSGMKLDDLADPKNIQNLSLDSQKQIQDQLPKVLAEQLAKDYKGKDNDLIKEFNEMFKDMSDNEVYQQAIQDNKLDVTEIENLVNELQKVAYTSSSAKGDKSAADALSDSLSENGDQLNQINDVLKSNNKSTDNTLKLLKENHEKQEKVNQQLEQQGKNLDQRVTSLTK